MNEIVLSTEIQGNIDRLEELRKAILVTTPEQRKEVLDTIKEAKAAKEQVVKFFSDMKKKTYDAWKSVCEKEKYFTLKCDGYESVAKQAVLKYDNAEEQKRIAEQRRLQAEADEKARKEREALLKRAETYKTPEKAQAALEAAAAVTAPVVEAAPAAPKEDGESVRKIWKWKVVNPSLIPREYLTPNAKMLDGLARSTKGAVPIPGIEFYSETVLAVKS